MLDYNTLHGKYGKKRSTGAAQTDAPASAKKDTVGLIDYDALRKKYGTGKKRQSKPAEAPHTTAAKKEALRLMESGALTPTAVMRRKLGVPVEQQSKTILRESEKVNRQVKAAESEVRRDARDRDKAAGGYAAAFSGVKIPVDKHPVASTYAAARGAVQTEEQKATAEKAAALGRLMNQQNDLARAYYFTENEEQRGRISRDTTMQGKQKGVGDLQSVISMAIKVAADAQNPGSGGEPAHIQQFKERLAREYGITQAAINNYALYGDDDSVPADGRYTNISQFIHQLEREQQRLSDEMTAEGYDYNRMAEYQQRLKNATEAKVRAEEREKAAKEDPGMASLGSVFARALQPLDYAGAALSGLGRSDPSKPKSYVPIDPAAMDTTNAVNTVRGTVAKMAEEKWGPVGSFAYQTGMSMADFLFTAGITGNFSGGGKTAANLSLGIMGSNAAADTTVSALNRGLSNRQALTLGAIAGAAEIVTEKVSLETLLDMTSLSKSRMGYVLQNIIAEGSEEATSDVINWTADVLVSRDKSEWRQAIAAYQAQGMDENTAFWHALGDQAVEIGVDFLGGAASGGIMAGGSVAIDSHYDRAAGRDFRQSMNNADGLYQAAIDTGLESGADSDAHRLATRYQQKLDKKGALSDGQLGRLYRANIAAIEAEGDVDTPAMQNPAEGAEMPSTAINTDTATHTPEQQAAIEAYQADADETLKEVFQGYLENPNQGFSRHNISSVSQRQAQDAQRLLGGDYAGYRNAINSNGIQHILGEHGPSGTVDHSLADLNDIARMGHVLDNYDNVELVTYESGDTDYSREFRDKNDRPAPMLKFSKRVDGTYYVVEAIPESKYKKFWVVSAYMEKADGGTQAPDANGPRTTPNASLASSPSASTDSIPQTAQDVNKRRSHEAEVLKPHAIAKMGLGANGKTGLVNAIDTRRELGMFSDTMTEENLVEGYIDVYLAGLNGATLEQGGLPLTAGVQAEKLSPTERMQAYYNGVNDAQARVEANKRAANFAKVAGTEKGLVWDSYVETDLLPETADRINELAKRLNVRVTFADSVDGGQANGQINGADIVIAKDAENPALVVFGHEVGHWLEETAPEQYQAFRQFAEQRYHTEILERMAQYELAGKELDYDGALREFVNDDIGRLIGDTDALNDFINENRENRTLLQRFADALRTLWKKLTGKDRQQVKTAEEALVAALRASEAQAAKLEKAGQVQDFSQETADAGARYSIGYDVDNTPFVTVEDDILNGVPKSEWVKTVKENLREKFPEGVTVARSRIDIDKTTQRETTWSKYTQWLRESSPDVYADKMRALGSVDEILRASQGYINEEPNHPRKDDIIDFARGTVQLRIGENDYTAEVVVGGRKDGSMVLYDVLNLAKTTIKEKSQARQTANPSPGTGRNTVTASGDTVTHPGEDVKPNYSLKGTEHAERMVELERENAALQAKYEQAMKQTRRSDAGKVSEAQVGRYAKVLMDHVGVKGDAKALGLKLQTMYDAVASGKDLDGAEFTYRDFRQMANDIAGDLVSRAVLQDNTMYEDYAALRAHIRDTRIVVDAETRESITDYADFRKRNMGRLRLAHGETGNIDLVYNELSREYPGLFDPELSYGQDQLERIAEVMEMIYARKEFNPWAGDMARATQMFANEIMEQFWDLPGQEATFADRQWRQREALKRRHMAEVKDAVRAEREKGKVREQKLKEQFQKKRQEAVDISKRETINRMADRMTKRLLYPTSKQHVPEQLRGPALEVLASLNRESGYELVFGKDAKYKRVLRGEALDSEPTVRTEKMRALRDAIDDLLKDDSYMGVVDPDMMENIKEVEALKDIPLVKMSSKQVSTVGKVLCALERAVTSADKAMSQAKYAEISTWANNLREDTKTRREMRHLPKGFLSMDMATPITFFERYGEAGREIYRAMQAAEGKSKVLACEVGEQTRKIVDNKTVQKLQTTRHEFELESGKRVTLTTDQIMEVYELLKRRQSHDHILEGGIYQPEIGGLPAGKNKKIYRGTEPLKLTVNDLRNITQTLTPEEIRIADRLQGLMTGMLAEYGNQASMEVYGYRKFTEPDYWPIHVAKEGTYASVEQNRTNTAKSTRNMGMTKATIKHANNPLNIHGAFQTFAQHASDMIEYSVGLAVMEDAERLFNFTYEDTGKTVKDLLDTVGGTGSQRYWTRLMEDFQNGIKERSDTEVWPMIGGAIGKFKATRVAANFQVIIQQPTAWVKAMLVLNPKHMIEGLAKGATPGKGWAKALKYAPIAVQKDLGGIDMGSRASMKEILFDDKTRLKRANDFLGGGAQAADAFTWGKLWNACEWTIADKEGSPKKGSEAFYKKVGDLFTDVICQTQVVDGIMQRSQIMRSGNAVVQQGTAFMGEPVQAYNILMRTYENWRYEQNGRKRGVARKQFARAAVAVILTNVVTALAKSITGAMRDDDPDKKFGERYLAQLTGIDGDEETLGDKIGAVLLDGNLAGQLNPIGWVPFIKEVESIFEGYDVSRTEFETVKDFIGEAKNFIKAINGDSKSTVQSAMTNLLASGANFFSIPAENIKRDMMSAVRTLAVEADNLELQYEIDKAIYNMGNKGNRSRFTYTLYRAIKAGDKELEEKIIRELKEKGGMEDKDISSAVEKQMKKDQGVKEVKELDERYVAPDDREVYERAIERLTGSALGKKATEQQLKDAKADAYKFTTRAGGEKDQERWDRWEAAGMDAGTYALYQLAEEMADKPNENGNLGTITNEEREVAIRSMGLSRRDSAAMWVLAGGKEKSNPWR